jgi:hypothetical protein
MPVKYRSPFEAFEACKDNTGADFRNAWHQLMAMDPGNGVGVLLAMPEANMDHLTGDDWALARPHVLALEDRVREALLGRWAFSQRGPTFVAIWGDLLAADPNFAHYVLMTHRNPDLTGVGMDVLMPLLEHQNEGIRLASIMALREADLTVRRSTAAGLDELERILDTVAPHAQKAPRRNPTPTQKPKTR